MALVIAAALYAEPAYLQYRQAFGIKASNLSGYGAFYGFKPSDRTRIQATGIYYLFDHRFKDNRRIITDYTIGLEFQKDLVQEMRHRYYLMAGGYYYHDNDETRYKNDETRSDSTFHSIKDSYNCGIGIGYEYFFHRVTLGLELGYKYYYDKSREKEGEGEWLPVLEKVTKVGAGLNLGFIF